MLDPTKPLSSVSPHTIQPNVPTMPLESPTSELSAERQSVILERLATQFGVEADEPLKSAKEFTQIHNKAELGDQIKNVIIKTRQLFQAAHDKTYADEFKSLNNDIKTLVEKSHDLKNGNQITTGEEELACESLEQLQQILLNFDDWTAFQHRIDTFDVKIEDSAFAVTDSMYSAQRGMNSSALLELGNSLTHLQLLFKDAEKRLGGNYPFAEEAVKQLAGISRNVCWMGADYLEGLDRIHRHIEMFEKLYARAADSENVLPRERLQIQTEAAQEFERLGLFLSNLESILPVLSANLGQLQKMMENVSAEDKGADAQFAVKMIGKDVGQFLDRISTTKRSLPETFQKLNAAIGRCHMEEDHASKDISLDKECFQIIEDYHALSQKNVSPETAVKNYVAAKRKLEAISFRIETLTQDRDSKKKPLMLDALKQLEKSITAFQTTEENHLQTILKDPFNFEDAVRDSVINDATAATTADHWIARAWQSLDPGTWSESTKKCVHVGLTSVLLTSEILKSYQALQQRPDSGMSKPESAKLTDEQIKFLEKETALLGVLCSDKYQTLTEENIDHLTRKLPDTIGREAVREALREIIHTHNDQPPTGPEIRMILGQYAKMRTQSMQNSEAKTTFTESLQRNTISSKPQASETTPDGGILSSLGTTLRSLMSGAGKIIQAFTWGNSGEYGSTERETRTAVANIMEDGFESARSTNEKLSAALHQNRRGLSGETAELRRELHTAMEDEADKDTSLLDLADRHAKLETAAANANNAIQATEQRSSTIDSSVEVRVEDLIGFVSQLGGAHFEEDLLVPNNYDNINSVLNGLITPLSDYLGNVGPTSTSDSSLWRNICKTAEELVAHAEQKKEYFMGNLKTIAKQIGAEANFGPDEKFATKQLDSLKAKIEKDVKNIGMSEEEATARMFDPLRGTIIADTPEQLLKAINEFKNWIKEINGKIIFRNHLKGMHPNGYIGIHANVLIPEEGHPENEGILCEVQFHLRKYNDGTLTGAKEFNHKYYKSTLSVKAVNYASKTVTAFALCHMLDVCVNPAIILEKQLALIPVEQPKGLEKIDAGDADVDHIQPTTSPLNYIYTGVDVNVEDLIGFYNEVGGSYIEQDIPLPNNPKTIESVLNGLINPIAEDLGNIEPAVTSASYQWKNQCQNAEELHTLAEQNKDFFKGTLQTIAEKTDSEANFGPDARFATKELDSLKNKVKMDVEIEGISVEEATAKIGDALRGTIISDTTEQLKNSIDEVKSWIKSINGKIAFKNMWKEKRPSGYVGVHAKILIPVEGRPENEGLLCEVQFHLRKYNDGSLKSAKEFTHGYYKSTLSPKLVNYASKTVSAFALCHMLDVCVRPSTILEEQLALVPVIEPKKISLVQTMFRRMQTQGSLIITGAPGSCKSELMDLALPAPFDVFDLRDKFLKFHFKEMGIVDLKEMSRIKKENYRQLKGEQLLFINQKLDEFEKELLESSSEVIVMDEMDIAVGNQVQGDSLDAALLLIEMAGRLKKQGKKIVVFLHEEGLKTPELMNALKAAELIEENGKIVQTRFFTEQEQRQMLEWTGFNNEQAAAYIEKAQGLPAAYLQILKRVKQSLKNANNDITMTEQEALVFAKSQAAKNLRVIRKIAPAHVSELINDLARGVTNQKECLANKDALIATGLVTFKDDVAILPPLVAEVINNKT